MENAVRNFLAQERRGRHALVDAAPELLSFFSVNLKPYDISISNLESCIDRILFVVRSLKGAQMWEEDYSKMHDFLFLAVNPIGRALGAYVRGDVDEVRAAELLGYGAQFWDSVAMPLPDRVFSIETFKAFAHSTVNYYHRNPPFFPRDPSDWTLNAFVPKGADKILRQIMLPEDSPFTAESWARLRQLRSDFSSGKVSPIQFTRALASFGPQEGHRHKSHKSHKWMEYAHAILSGKAELLDAQDLRAHHKMQEEDSGPRYTLVSYGNEYTRDRLDALSWLAPSRGSWVTLCREAYPGFQPSTVPRKLPICLVFMFYDSLPYAVRGMNLFKLFRGTSNSDWEYNYTDPLFTTSLVQVYDLLDQSEKTGLGL